MKAKQRVIAAMERRIPDRVPVFPVITAYQASRVLNVSYRDIVLNPHLGFDALLAAWRRYRFDGFEVGLGPAADWRERYRVETEDGVEYLADAASGRRLSRLEPDDLPVPLDLTPPLQDDADVGKLTVETADEIIRTGRIEPVRRLVQAVGDEAFVAGTAASQSLNFLVAQRGSTQAMLDLVDNPKLAHAIMEIGTAQSIEVGKALIAAGVDGIYIGDAWASASIISPQQYRGKRKIIPTLRTGWAFRYVSYVLDR